MNILSIPQTQEALIHVIKRSLGYTLITLWVVLIPFFNESAQAKDLGVIGAVYSIQETDLLQWITARLEHLKATGKFKQLNKTLEQHAINTVKRPRPVAGVVHTREPRSFTFDPSILIDHDIKDQNGQVIVRAGTKVNPLDHVSLMQPLLFIDADDPKELLWAKQQDTQFHHREKIILIKGPVIALMKQWHQRLYFDQLGKLVQRFRIEQVPAIVTQEAKHLRVQEVKP